MERKSVCRKIDRPPTEKARLTALRDKFQCEKPSLEQLVASGDYSQPIKQGEVLSMMALAAELASYFKKSGR